MKKDVAFISLLWRSFAIQALWNFEGLQNAGFLYAIFPTIKKLYPDKEERKAVVLRHIEFFNTQPYMASIVLGLTAAMEQQAREGKKTAEEISSLKKNMAGPLAAMGDALFWATFRPLIVLLTTGLVLFFIHAKPLFHPLLIPVFLSSSITGFNFPFGTGA